ncbi:vacuolar protein sorting-associated protein 27-like, partial [Lingula anatina]|uniref:Vacuolar protein sorting-associated protein 27-like n=1 Tax=Lingula anatina TaxID=7574 RepID=A0A1S3J1C0_LINAN
MAQTMKPYPEPYPQQDPRYGYDQGPQPSTCQAQPYVMVPTQQAYPEAYPQQTLLYQYGYGLGPLPSNNPAQQAQVIVNQPFPVVSTVHVFGPAQPKPPNFMALSIFVVLCCCFPIGIIALKYS